MEGTTSCVHGEGFLAYIYSPCGKPSLLCEDYSPEGGLMDDTANLPWWQTGFVHPLIARFRTGAALASRAERLDVVQKLQGESWSPSVGDGAVAYLQLRGWNQRRNHLIIFDSQLVHATRCVLTLLRSYLSRTC